MTDDTKDNELSTFAYWAVVWWTTAMAMVKDKDERYIAFMKFYDLEVHGLRTYAAEMINYDYRLTPVVSE